MLSPVVLLALLPSLLSPALASPVHVQGRQDQPTSFYSVVDGPVSVPLLYTASNSSRNLGLQEAFWSEQQLARRVKYADLLNKRQRAELDRDLVQRAERRRALGERADPLYDYNFDIGYLASVQVGTPPQDFLVVPDTGSANFLLFDENCTGCAGHPALNDEASSSYKPSHTPFSVQFGTGSATGVWVNETVTMGGSTGKDQTVALVQSGDVAKYIHPKGSGIMGLSFGSNPVPFWRRLAASVWTKKQFGFYLKRNNLNPRHTPSYFLNGFADGGDLTFGGLNNSLFKGEIDYYDANVEKWWQIVLDSINVNGQNVDIKELAIIDTGTTDIVLPAAAAEAFHAAIPGAFKYGDSSATWIIPCEAQIDVSFRFGDASRTPYKVVAEDMVRSTIDGINGCRSMVESSSTEGLVLLGAAFLKNVYSAWNYDPPQVGFAPLADGYNIPPVGRYANDTSSSSSAPPTLTLSGSSSDNSTPVETTSETTSPSSPATSSGSATPSSSVSDSSPTESSGTAEPPSSTSAAESTTLDDINVKPVSTSSDSPKPTGQCNRPKRRQA